MHILEYLTYDDWHTKDGNMSTTLYNAKIKKDIPNSPIKKGQKFEQVSYNWGNNTITFFYDNSDDDTTFTLEHVVVASE